jgi:hypothetical protein
MNRSTFSLTVVAVFIIVIPLARSAFGCYATWAWDTRPNVYATEADLQQCIASGAAWNDGGTYHVRDLHKQAGYDAIYVIGSAAPGAENLGTFARRAIGSYYVLVEVQRPAKTQIEYRDRTVTVPVDRIVEQQVAVPTPEVLPALVAEPSPSNLWMGDQPFAFISDPTMTQLRSVTAVSAKGTGGDEIISVPCPTDTDDQRRVAYYARATTEFSGPAESLRSYWVLISVTTPRIVEVRDRDVPVPADPPVPAPTPSSGFQLGYNPMTAVLLGAVVLLVIFIWSLAGARGVGTKSLCNEVERRFLSGRYR